FAVLEARGEALLPPDADDPLQFALRSLRDVVEERDGGEGSGADGGDAVVGGRGSHGLAETAGEVDLFGVGKQILTPVVDERLLAEVGLGREGPGDRLAAYVLIARYLIIEGLCESSVRHWRVAGDQRGELLPAGGGA